jgi:Cdc6-like AAA superfamily ATPase
MAVNRLDLFRQHMARLDATAGPREIIEGGYYVAPPGNSVADQLVARLSLKPSSSHMVLGGVGSGKTTQLMTVCEQLNRIEDTRAVYIDVSEHCDLKSLDTNDLAIMLSRELVRHGNEILGQESKELGEVEQAAEDFDKALAWQGEVGSQAGLWRPVQDLRRTLAQAKPHFLIVLDSLDRLDDMAQFEKVVTTWLPRLAELDLGVVLTAPLATLYGARRVLLDRVDRYYHLPWMDVREDANREFLAQVLRARIPESLCPDTSCIRLIELSGGVLRDLVALTQSAVEEAYVEGTDTVTLEHVQLVADAFGRKHLLGLDAEDLAILQKVRTSGSFVPTSDEHLALVHTRRVLEYRHGARISYRVHPTTDALLAELAEP